MPSVDRKLTLEELEQRFAKLKAPTATAPAEEVEPLRWEYRMAASVLSTFEPTTLRPLLARDVREGALRYLMEDSEAVANPGGQTRWTLRQGVRQAAIARLGSRSELLRALEVNPPAEPDLLQRMISDWMKGTAQPIEEQGLEELSCTLQVLHWFRSVLPELPNPEQVRRRLEWLQLLAPFRFLAGQRFCGRKAELRKLRDYVGVVDVSAMKAVQTLLEAFSSFSRRPLLVHGPGGMGKSTLLARFILDYAESKERIPFAYLDFDDPTLSLDNPATLLVEITRQLLIQHPEMEALIRFRRICEGLAAGHEYVGRLPEDDEFKPTAEKISSLLDRFESSLRRRREDRTGGTWGIWRLLVRILSLILAVLSRGQLPRMLPRFLLVLDTFEEVQFRGVSQVETLELFLMLLQQHFPEQRTVICGRAPTEHLKADLLSLTELEPEASRELLRLSGVEDREAIDNLVKQLGGNPLTLKLAADVVKREGSIRGGIEGLKTRRLFFFSARESVIQGQLYQRILGHIHDPRVRKLAHPGLVVRRITPEIIAKVLAGPCELHLATSGEAEALFEEFKREVSLVFVAADQSLHHRADVRRVMLEALKAEKPVQVREIHEAAVRFYESKEDALSRAEEIYHRLSLGESPRGVEGRWMPGVEQYLSNALEELPPSARPLLAARLGQELPLPMWDQADLADWERGMESRVERLLAIGDANRALQLLAGRKERLPGSSLYVLEAQALQRLEREAEALEVVEEGLAAASPMAGASSVSLLLLRAELATATEQQALADESLRYAEQIARRVGREDFLLRVLVARAWRSARSPEHWRERAAALQTFLLGASDQLLKQHAPLARLAVGMVAGGQPEVLARGLEVVRLGNARPVPPEALDVLELLLRTGWPAAQDAFESGLIEPLLLKVLEQESCPPELNSWIARIFLAEGGPLQDAFRTVRGVRLQPMSEVRGSRGEGVPGWLVQALTPLGQVTPVSHELLYALAESWQLRQVSGKLEELLQRMGETRHRVPLLLLRAEFASRIGSIQLAERCLQEVIQATQGRGDFGRMLQALTRRAQLTAETPEQWHERRNSLAKVLTENPGAVTSKHLRLARLATGLVSASHPALLLRGLEELGLGTDGFPFLDVEVDIEQLLQRTGWLDARALWLSSGKPEPFLTGVLKSKDCPPELPALIALAFIEQGSLALDTPTPSGLGDVIT